MKTKYIIIFFLVTLSFPLWAQSFTPCTDCDTITMRHRNYYIDAWYDTCQCYYNYPYDPNHPNRSIYLRTPIQHNGIIYAKRLYTSEPLQIKGLTALVDIHARYHYFRDTIKLPEYLYLYQKGVGNDMWIPDTTGVMIRLDSVRWDTIKPHYAKFRISANEDVFNYCYAYDVYFNKPVTVDSVFYIGGTANSNYFGPAEGDPNSAYSYIPTFYMTPENTFRDCKPQGSGRTLERAGSVWWWGDFHMPNVFGYYLPIVDNDSVSVLSADTSQGAVAGSGYHPHLHTVTINATPYNGYVFSHWDDGNTDNPRQFKVTRDTTFTAYFRNAEQRLVQANANNSEWGTVTGGGWYMEGDTATLDAQPTNELYEFSHWDDSDTTNPRNIIVTQDTVFTANFIYHVGISDIDNTLKLTLSPNPAKTRLHIDCAQPVMNMSVIDANGRTVENISPSCQSFDIDVSRYTPGVYILSITTASGNASAKVVIGQQ